MKALQPPSSFTRSSLGKASNNAHSAPPTTTPTTPSLPETRRIRRHRACARAGSNRRTRWTELPHPSSEIICLDTPHRTRALCGSVTATKTFPVTLPRNILRMNDCHAAAVKFSPNSIWQLICFYRHGSCGYGLARNRWLRLEIPHCHVITDVSLGHNS